MITNAPEGRLQEIRWGVELAWSKGMTCSDVCHVFQLQDIRRAQVSAPPPQWRSGPHTVRDVEHGGSGGRSKAVYEEMR